jgi:phasin family protein
MTNENPFKYLEDFQKNFSQFKLPGIDPNQWAETYQRNLEAMNRASQAIATGVQAYAEKQAAMLQASMDRAQEAIKEASETEDPSAKATRQLERAKAAYNKAVEDMNEISQIVAKTNAEATEAIEKRISESFEEIQNLLSSQKE